MTFLTKLVYVTATTTVIGGGVGLGLYSKKGQGLQKTLKGSNSLKDSQINLSNNSVSSSVSSNSDAELSVTPPQDTLELKTQEGETTLKAKKTEDTETREKEQKEKKEGGMGNCQVDDSMTKILQTRGKSEQEYYSVSCTNIGIDESEDLTFGDHWRGAFPKTLFNSQDLPASHKLEIKVKTDLTEDTGDVDYPFNIEFWSQQFKSTENSKISGIWNYEEDLDETNTTGAIVKLTNSSDEKDIYLLTRLDTDGEIR